MAIFPQGHRYPGINPLTTPRKNGAALIAYHSGCDVLPVCIKVKKNKYSLFRQVEIVYGEVIKNSSFEFENGGGYEYKRATDFIFAKIGELANFSVLPEYNPEKSKKGDK